MNHEFALVHDTLIKRTFCWHISRPAGRHFIHQLLLQGKMSRLGKEARAAGQDPKGYTSHPDSAPTDSKAGSGVDSDSGDNEDNPAHPKEEGGRGRRTRQASVQPEPAWLELEETPPKHKSRRRASCNPFVGQIH